MLLALKSFPRPGQLAPPDRPRRDGIAAFA